jgi:dolichol-phosphate mannosyltransferase
MSTAQKQIDLTVVVPVKNEAENVAPLVREIVAALGSESYEIVYVDDGSTDTTVAMLEALRPDVPQLRVIQHAASCGQSAALRTGVLLAQGHLIATLDGDGQNDPADLPHMLAELRANPDYAMIAGQRLKRQDSAAKRFSSRIANKVRASVLQDDTPDTGCGIKLFRKAAFLSLPYFDHIHRFLPALMKREGLEVGLLAVNHRHRMHGRSKYGINNRLWVGLVDLAGVWWLMRRMRRPTILPPDVASS